MHKGSSKRVGSRTMTKLDAESRRAWRAAYPRIEAAVRHHPRLGQAWFNLGFAQFALGLGEQAAPAFEKAAALGYHKTSSLYNVACALALAGHADQAFEWLDKAIAAGFDSWDLIRSDADLDHLRQDPRFQKLLELAHEHWGRHPHI